jgi:hypothetical protein
MFDIPEKLPDINGEHVYQVVIKEKAAGLLTSLHWDGKSVVPTLSVQSELLELRNSVLKSMTENTRLFRNPPVLKSLLALAVGWGVQVQTDKTIVWGPNNLWDVPPADIKGQRATVRLLLKAVWISRLLIQPVWRLDVIEKIPDPSIDIVFANDDEDVKSVGINEIESGDDAPVYLEDVRRKRMEAKMRVQEAFRLADEARERAEMALHGYHQEFEPSDDESEFGQEEEENED